jgi:aspartyl/asparaginyl-tRNA synthetase
MAMKITGTIVKLPIVKEKIIFTSIKEDEDAPIQAVLFRSARPAKLSNLLINAKLDDKVTITGRLEKNPKNNEMQIIIDDIESESLVDISPMPSVF